MASFPEARDALLRTIRKVFPDARPVPRWAGVEAWGAPRPDAVVDQDAPGTYDPRVTVIGIADRRSGPVVYFLDPGDYFVLDAHRALLEGAGFRLGRGCIMHTRKGPLPTEALEALFRRVKERDARDAAAAAKKAATRQGQAPAPAAKRATAKQAATTKAKPAAKGAAAAGAAKAATVEEYLARLPDDQRVALERLRGQILAAAPKATERIGYGIPTFAHEGPLVHMAAFRDHCSFFPGSGDVTRALASDLEGRVTSKGTIRFTPGTPLPAALVKKIVRMRVAENEARAKARRAGKGAKATAKKAATGKKAAKKKAPPRR